MGGEREISLGGGDRVMIEPWDAVSPNRLENLVRIDGDGAIRWRARLPENSGPDCFVAIGRMGDMLVATTWTGYRVELNPDNGEHMRMTFVK